MVVLFISQNESFFENPLNKNTNGLTYRTTTISELITKDTDGDGIPDWEERLWGTDINKKETTPGIGDKEVIDKLKAEQEKTNTNNNTNTTNTNNSEQNLTQTEKFSRELFATVSTLNQNGSIDQNTIDKISSSLADNIKNTTARKTYTILDIKTIKNETLIDIKTYVNNLNKIDTNKNNVKYNAIDVLKKFQGDGNTIDENALKELDPIVKNLITNKNELLNIKVPLSLAILQLNLINDFEKVIENLTDIQNYNTDVIIAFGGINKYYDNSNTLIIDYQNLNKTIIQKLKNIK